MAKKAKKVAEDVAVPMSAADLESLKKALNESTGEWYSDVPVEKPYVLVEGVNGGEPTRVMLPDPVNPRDRVVMVDGKPYEHCAEDGDGRWVYRASR